MVSIALLMSGERPPGSFQQVPMTFAQALRVQRMDVEGKAHHARWLVDVRLTRDRERRRVAKLTPAEVKAEADAIHESLLADIRRWGSE